MDDLVAGGTLSFFDVEHSTVWTKNVLLLSQVGGIKLGYQWVMTSKPVEVQVPITELHYVGWAKIKTNGHRQQTWTNVTIINNSA